MIGIIAAMKIEADLIVDKMSNKRTEQISGVDYVIGKIAEKDVVIAVCGIGKVFAAICAQTMILKYHPEMIINTGVGGSLVKDLKIFGIAVAESVVQHDMNTMAIGDVRGLISGINMVYIPCDKLISEKIRKCAEELGSICKTGVLASGDIFVHKEKTKAKINGEFNAIACDMEGASIGQVCFVNEVPFSIIRAISDNADVGADIAYPAFAKTAAQKSAETLIKYIESK